MLARAQGHDFKGYLHWGNVLAVEGSWGKRNTMRCKMQYKGMIDVNGCYSL